MRCQEYPLFKHRCHANVGARLFSFAGARVWFTARRELVNCIDGKNQSDPIRSEPESFFDPNAHPIRTFRLNPTNPNPNLIV